MFAINNSYPQPWGNQGYSGFGQWFGNGVQAPPQPPAPVPDPVFEPGNRPEVSRAEVAPAGWVPPQAQGTGAGQAGTGLADILDGANFSNPQGGPAPAPQQQIPQQSFAPDANAQMAAILAGQGGV